ncbi:MAG TPA: hypothetical protein VGH13_22930 [Xanthobacteraceae bacterium]
MLRGSKAASHACARQDRGSSGEGDYNNGASVFGSHEQRARLTAGVLRWLTANLEFFDPPQEDAILEETPEHILPGRSRKAFGELGLALRLVHRVAELRDHEDVRHLARVWLAMARARNIFFDARRRVHLVPLMAVALTVFATLDQAPEHVRRSLQTVLDRHFIDRAELASYPKLDLKYYFDALGLRHAFDNDAILFARSTLTSPPSLPHAQRLDLYAITHLIFDLTDFGTNDIRSLAGPCFNDIRDYVKLAMAMSLADRDFDLTAEFMINRMCLGDREDKLNRVAADALCEAQQPAGFIPDCAWLAGLKESADPHERTKEEFFAVYHPTLVTLILLACDMNLAPRSSA